MTKSSTTVQLKGLVKYNSDCESKTLIETAKLPVVVFFTAPWCMACKSFSPILDQLGEELSKKAVIIKIDIDENPLLAAEHHIRSLPTIMVFVKGDVVDTKIGVSTKGDMLKFINGAK